MKKALTLAIICTIILCYELCEEKLEYTPHITENYHNAAFKYALKKRDYEHATHILHNKLKQLYVRSYIQQVQASTISADVALRVHNKLKQIWLTIGADSDVYKKRDRLDEFYQLLNACEQQICYVVMESKSIKNT